MVAGITLEGFTMSKVETRTLYTLAELKEQFPDGYARVLERWQDACDRFFDVPWQSETMDSLRAVVDACGGKCHDWQIGPYAPSHLSVRVDEHDEDDEGNEVRRDAEWFWREVLAPNGYARGEGGEVEFPGVCPFTGYCADENMLEAVWQDLRAGVGLREALEGLADVASRMMEANAEQERDAETMEANWDGLWFTEHGDEE